RALRRRDQQPQRLEGAGRVRGQARPQPLQADLLQLLPARPVDRLDRASPGPAAGAGRHHLRRARVVGFRGGGNRNACRRGHAFGPADPCRHPVPAGLHQLRHRVHAPAAAEPSPRRQGLNHGVLAARRPQRILAWLLLVLVAAGWLRLQAYQSHYESGLRALGDRQTEALLGEPKSGRGDEWSTYLPMLKQAQREGFPARSSLEPYRERFDWFITLPHAGASLVLLPNQVAWWIASPGVALSFQGLYYNLLLLLSVCWLMRNLRVGTGLAVATGVVLLFSHLYQAWWTSNFACLGASILPFAVLTSQLRWLYRGPLLAWSIGHMLLGQLYPPFYFALAVAVLPFVAAARPDLLQWRNLAWATASVAAGCAAALYLKLGYIEAVAGTAYPGSRFSMGGDTSASTLVSVLFPTWPAVPAPGVGLAFYELGMAASFFPLLAIAALPTVAWTREVRRVALVSVLVGAVLAFYMVSGFP